MITQAGEAVLLFGAFTESKLGKTGLTVTVDVYRVTLADLTVSQVVTAGSAAEIGGGGYAYRHVTTSSAAYYYFAIFKTATTSVDAQHVFSLQIAGIPFAERIDVASSTIHTAVSDLADQVDTWFADTTPILNKVDSTLVLDTGSVYQFTANALELAPTTGLKLASDGLDLIAVPTLTGPASTFPGYVYQLWRRFFKKAVNDRTGNTLKTYADNGTTVVTTQTTSTQANVETVGSA